MLMNRFMLRALELAEKGGDAVLPNPKVGCVIVKNDQIVGEGYHEYFGGPHAEINALADAGEAARGATVYVTLEPCSHSGKTPPCTDALIMAGVRKVNFGMYDPNPLVTGKGIEQLRKAGIEVSNDFEEPLICELNAPYIIWMKQQRPWVCAKWAMTLDGKMATRTGASQWISSECSRAVVHRLRAKMDAIIIGMGTARNDDPMLTARPFPQKPEERVGQPRQQLSQEQQALLEELIPLPTSQKARTPLRVVLDSFASLRLESRLVQTASKYPVLIGVGPDASRDKIQTLRDHGCEILFLPGKIRKNDQQELGMIRSRDLRPGSSQNRQKKESIVQEEQLRKQNNEKTRRERLHFLLHHLYNRGLTNVLIEGGGRLLGSFFDAQLIDEAHVFIAPKIIGGQDATTPVGGIGLAEMFEACQMDSPKIHYLNPDVYVHGILRY